MKVLVIANIRKQQGGITTQVLELCDSLKNEGIEIELVSTHGSMIERFSGLIEVFRKTKKTDLIIGVGCAYFGVFPMLVASVISVLLRKRILYNFHDGQVYEFLNKYHGLLKLFFRKNLIVVATEFLHDAFIKYGFNSITIGNHLNDVIPFSEKRENNKGTLRFMWARSFERLYRADIILEAAVEILKNYNVEFHMYGGGSLKNYFMSRYDVTGIVFHDFMKRDSLLNEYCKYDVFVNTSDYDNFPMSIVEAGMNDLLVVTSRAGGIASLYTDSEVLFFERGNSKELVRTLKMVIMNTENISFIKKNLKNKVTGFTWDSVKGKWLSIINNNQTENKVLTDSSMDDRDYRS